MKLAISSIAAACAAVSMIQVAHATPYASGVAVTGTAGTFVLNQPATSVVVTYGNGTTQTIDGATSGSKTFTLPSVGSTYSIRVARATPTAGFLTGAASTIGADVTEGSPRGVAVNTDASSAFFGRIYVANSSTAPGDGLFAFNADKTDALGQGSTARTGGLDFTTSGSNSPFRVQVGQDNFVYIGDAGTAATTGGVYRIDGGLTTGQKVLSTTGSFPSSIVATGSLGAGNLTIYGLDQTTATINGLKRYDVGAGPLPSAAAPVSLAAPLLAIAGVTVDLAVGPSGKFYLMQDRAAGGPESGLYVYASDGTTQLYDSLADTTAKGLDNDAVTAGTQDYLQALRGVTISPDGKYAGFVSETNQLIVVDLDSNGLPILSTRRVVSGLAAFGTAITLGRDIAFDAADNLYAVSSGAALFRAFDPGGATIATTAFNGTTSTFALTIAVPEPTTLAALAGVGALMLRRRRVHARDC